MNKRYLFLLLSGIALCFIFIALQFDVGSFERDFVGVTALGIIAYLLIMLLEGFFWLFDQKKKS
ncbi:hypothetical protein JCM30760_22470 [Thiomicrorhabdus hydrogeniphila]